MDILLAFKEEEAFEELQKLILNDHISAL